MSAETYHFECCVMAAASIGTPHLEALQDSNPGLQTHVHFYPEGDGAARTELWRNGDRNLLAWWKANRETVTAEAVLFLDWDAWVNIDLRRVFPELKPGVGMVAAQVLSGILAARSFAPFREVNRLPRELRGMAAGVSPLGVLMVSRECLDALVDERWDGLFAEDIFSELRMPSVARFLRFAVVAVPMPHVGWTPVVPSAWDVGIYHPVKEPVLP